MFKCVLLSLEVANVNRHQDYRMIWYLSMQQCCSSFKENLIFASKRKINGGGY